MKSFVTHQKADEFVKSLDLKGTSKSNFWEIMDDMLAFLYVNYPVEIVEHQEACALRRNSSVNVFHSNKDMSERILGSPPERFYWMICKYTNSFKEIPYKSVDEMWADFFRRYKQFSFAQKI